MQPIQNASSNTYWAASDSNDIGDEIQGQIDNYYAYLTSSSLVDLWRKSFYAYYGMLPETALTGFGLFAVGSIIGAGNEGEIAKLKVNQLRNLITHLLVLTTQNRPAMECRAINSDSKSSAQARLGDGILDYFMREKNIESYLKDLVEIALVFGEAFIELDWDATAGKQYGVGPNGSIVYDGDITVRCYNPFDVVRDTTRNSPKNHSWYIVHDTEVSFDLAAKYPNFAKEILASSTDTTSARRFIDPTKIIPAAGVGSRSSELIDTYKLIHRPTPALSSGRFTKIVQGGLVLFDGPLPFTKMNINRMSAADVIGCPFGWTTSFDLLGIQDAVDKLYTILLTNDLATGMQNFWQPPGNEITKTQLGGGLNLLESVVKPEVLVLCQSPPEVMQLIGKLEGVMETLSGVSAVNRGEAPENLKSGSALAFVASQAITFSSGLQSSYNEVIESVGTGIIDMLKSFATTPRMAAIAGAFNKPLMRMFMGSDLENIDRVVVDATNAVSKTTAGKIQIAQDLLQAGQVDAREYLAVVETGTLEPLIQAPMSQIELIADENERMMLGQPVSVLIIDNHKFHVMEHASLLNNSAARQDPVLSKMVLDHIQEHINQNLQLQQSNPALLAMLGEPPVPGPTPPPNTQQPQGQAPGNPSAPVQNVIAAPNPTAAQNIKQPNMPNLPKGSPAQTVQAYQQLKQP